MVQVTFFREKGLPLSCRQSLSRYDGVNSAGRQPNIRLQPSAVGAMMSRRG